jgi:light-regulated signal transduction histidine kinase (bacteriophytochrome)
MTALTETREKVQGFAVGGVDYITKPFHADEVLARVTTQLRLRRLNRELEQELAERKRTEAELQRQTVLLHEANQELEAFSYTVSHDLNAPLRHIDGFIRIVLEESPAVLDTTMRKHLENAQAAAQRMKQMIETLLAFSRLTHQSIKKQIVSPDQLAQQAFAELAGDHKGRRVEVIMGALADTMADPQLLKLVFVNLLSNALKYTRPREVAQIEVGCTEREGEITYHVRDNGVGFDMRYAERIFAGFQRLHSQQDFEGTGVGLATVARIIRRHGGRIWVEAAIQQGATFYFTLGSGRARTEPPRTSDIGKAIK